VEQPARESARLPADDVLLPGRELNCPQVLLAWPVLRE
jgi:hypothetical protein